jgi:hypothetical protein
LKINVDNKFFELEKKNNKIKLVKYILKSFNFKNKLKYNFYKRTNIKGKKGKKLNKKFF